MAGLLTARVLSDHFERVTIVERDPIHDWPETRKGQPQARHLHGLLARGLQVLTHYFPDLLAALQEAGAVVTDAAATMHWYCYGGYRRPFHMGLPAAIASRPLLEWQIRRRVVALPNVTLLDGRRVEQVTTSADRRCVTGVQIGRDGGATHYDTLLADLVVDATGRGSRSPQWLERWGYSRPEASEVKVRIGYTTRLYRRNPGEPLGRSWIVVTPAAPQEKRFGAMLPIEGERWIVTLGGWAGDHAPRDGAGFLEFAQSLPAPDIYHLLCRSEPLSDASFYTFPFSQRHHYERLTRFPDGYLVIGDALCSFNPVYGQGMTSAALQAAELDQLLGERHGGHGVAGIARPFFKRAATVIDMPWQLAVGEDFRFPETEGEKALGTDLLNAYGVWVHKATHHDAVVGRAFLNVMNLIQPPTSLFHPKIMWRVLKSNWRSEAVLAH